MKSPSPLISSLFLLDIFVVTADDVFVDCGAYDGDTGSASLSGPGEKLSPLSWILRRSRGLLTSSLHVQCRDAFVPLAGSKYGDRDWRRPSSAPREPARPQLPCGDQMWTAYRSDFFFRMALHLIRVHQDNGRIEQP